MARILVCEDSATQAMKLRVILEAVDHEVVVAENGRIGLQYLMQYPFDLAVLDVMMPEIGGFELCRTIRMQPSIARLPVILLTTLSEYNATRRGQDVGADMYIMKPFDTNDLLRRVERLLSRRTMAAAPQVAQAPMAPAQQSPVPAAPQVAQPVASVQAAAAPAPFQPVPPAAPVQAAPPAAPVQAAPPAGAVPATAVESYTAAPPLPPVPTPASATTAVAPTPKETSAPAAVAPVSRPILLLVERTDALRNVMKASLGKLYNVLAVNSSAAAVEACNACQSGVDVLVAEAALCSSDLTMALWQSNPMALQLFLLDENAEASGNIAALPPRAPTLRKPFTVKALLERLKGLQPQS